MAALGGYLRTLREEQHITRSGLAGDLGVDATTLWRIEEGKQEPSGSLLINLVAAIRGDYDDVRRLLADRNANEQTGKEIADARLASYAITQVEMFRERVGSDQADLIARRLVNDPGFVDAIRRAAQQLLDD